ncbi:MAG: DUF1552 domain-containing protein [Deltaproteobacteria bacterium]|nr:DUF1552 domain-containing protein [Deltaproteobacteria bacterium]
MPSRRKFFYAMVTEHGGAWDSNFFPSQSLLTQKTNYAAAGHDIRWGELTPQSSGGQTSLSKVLTAPSSSLSPSLLRKINVIRGLDTAMHIGHNRGGVLGNFADTNGQNQLGLSHRPTLDQIMAWSPAVYATPQSLKLRSMAYGPSWGYANPAAQSGTVQKVGDAGSSRDLFDKIFTPQGTVTPVPVRKPIVDKIIANYRRLRDSDRRLSADDRRRLEAHMALLAETEARLANANSEAFSCGKNTKPTESHSDNYGNMTKYVNLLHDVFAVAFACGSSRIATVSLYPFVGEGGGDWHQSVAHQWQTNSAQDHLVKFYASVFRNAFLNFANKLDAIASGPGRTLLDDSLLMWTQESGMETHWQVSIPVVTAGGAGGAIKTGSFIDYRNMNSPHKYLAGEVTWAGTDDKARIHGLLYNQFLATALLAMGVQRPEFERWGHKGFGHVGFGTVPNEYPHATTRSYYQGETGKLFQIASDPLPVLSA